MDRRKYDISTDLIQIISAEQAYGYRIFPINQDTEVTFITDNTDIEDLKRELKVLLGISVILIKEDSYLVNLYLEKYYRKRDKQVKRSRLDYSEDFLLRIILEAKDTGSSDIHFETFEKQNRIRFRIDGKLLERYIVSKDEYPKIINRIKIMARLDIAEKRLPQDGRINITTSSEEFDIRVSSLPTLNGEKLVLRILSKDTTNVKLENLGFTSQELQIYKESVRKPNGIVLISGPTGSGKTTTLYATLKLLNTEQTNILTIEDPVEYTLEGVNQVQLKESIGFDFSSALRTFLRQDPDIIMVGEIRDETTANMAIRAALTGHLVLSTIHTNSAWSTVSRLLDMGIPSFLIASTLNVSVAQRLVRKLCNHCKVKEPFDHSLLPKDMESIELEEHYVPKGCSKCYQTGYKGRKAVYEILPITEELLENITGRKISIDNYLRENTIKTLKDNAMTLVAQGVTSYEEIYTLLI